MAELGDKFAVCICIAAIYQLVDLKNSFTFSLALCYSHGIACILKATFHEARPFFVADIVPTVCRFEHGNPSGHSLIAIGLYVSAWDVLCR